MQHSQLFPAAQTRDGQQVPGYVYQGHAPNPTSVVQPFPVVSQVHGIGQQVLSTPPSQAHTSHFPQVTRTYTHGSPSVQPFQPPFPVVHQYPPQTTSHSAQVVIPYKLSGDQKPLFPASKDRY